MRELNLENQRQNLQKRELNITKEFEKVKEKIREM